MQRRMAGVVFSGFVLAMIGTVSMLPLAAGEDLPAHSVVIGDWVAFDDGEAGHIPFVQYYHFKKDDDDFRHKRTVHLTNTSLSVDYRWQGDEVFGFKPNARWADRGGYLDYTDDGVQLKSMAVWGQSIGSEFYFERHFSPLITVLSAFDLAYVWYMKGSAQTTLVVPAQHFNTQFRLRTTLGKLNRGIFGVLQQGWQVVAEAMLQHRIGYQSSETMRAGGGRYTSQGTLGIDYGRRIDLGIKNINFKFSSQIGFQNNADRHNAWVLGSEISRRAVLPGYYYRQYRSHQFLLTTAACVVPIGTSWKLFVTPALGGLVIPKINQTIGYETARFAQINPSFSLAIDGWLGGQVPFHLGYGFGSASRHGKSFGTHTLYTYLVGGW